MSEPNFVERIDRLIEDKPLYLATMIGTSAVIVEYLAAKTDIAEMPPYVRYACAITAANIRAVLANDETYLPTIDKSEYRMGEQTQENIIRMTNEIITLLYNEIQKANNV
jgi:hypothetical protein